MRRSRLVTWNALQTRLRSPARARGGVRTVLLSLGGLAALAALSIGILIANLEPPASTNGTNPASAAPGASGADAASIAGEVRIAPELQKRVGAGAVLFIIAHKGGGPPFAVQRVAAPRFPVAYRLGPADVMSPGVPFQGEVTMSARLSESGTAGPAQPGDLEGEHPGSVAIGTHGVDILLARVR
jgi:cytochrome c-type biogenesis protein CcmH